MLAQLQDLYSDIDDAIEVGTSTIRLETQKRPIHRHKRDPFIITKETHS